MRFFICGVLLACSASITRPQSHEVTVPAPMRPRLLSPFLGLIPTRMSEVRDTQPTIVGRWNLTKRNPSAAISEPVRPIICRIEGTVPRQWIPWIHRGIDGWNPVFESLGFRNTIIVLDDSSTRPNDVIRAGNGTVPDSSDGCTVRWKPRQGFSETLFQATTKVTPAPRTGEIRSCTINIRRITDNPAVVFRMLHGMYPNVLAYPDSGLGRLVSSLLQHEMGHCLGLNHYIREGRYPADSLRNPGFVHRNGHVPSVMSYQFVNTVALPRDQIPLDDMIMRIGPHDRWLIRLLYALIPGATAPTDELPTLARWRSEQDSALYVRTLDPDSGVVSIGDDVIDRAAYTIQRLAEMVRRFDNRGDMERASTSSTQTSVSAKAVHGGTVGERDQAGFSATMVAEEWFHELNSMATVIAGGAVRHPYPRTQRQQEYVAFDSASQVHAVRGILARVLYGKDPFLHTVFQDIRRDTLLMLFSSVPMDWDRVQWRDQQLQTLDLLSNQIAKIAWQRPNVGEAICRVLEETRQRVKLYIKVNKSGVEQSHARAILQSLSSCSARSAISGRTLDNGM